MTRVSFRIVGALFQDSTTGIPDMFLETCDAVKWQNNQFTKNESAKFSGPATPH